MSEKLVRCGDCGGPLGKVEMGDGMEEYTNAIGVLAYAHLCLIRAEGVAPRVKLEDVR